MHSGHCFSLLHSFVTIMTSCVGDLQTVNSDGPPERRYRMGFLTWNGMDSQNNPLNINQWSEDRIPLSFQFNWRTTRTSSICCMVAIHISVPCQWSDPIKDMYEAATNMIHPYCNTVWFNMVWFYFYFSLEVITWWCKERNFIFEWWMYTSWVKRMNEDILTRK